MVNTLSQDNSPKFSIPAIYPINTAIEGLWKDSFNDEYRPNAVIDFVKIKNMLLDDPYNQLVPDYNYKIISPKDLCDILIKNGPKDLSVSFLESLPENLKRCLADIILWAIPLDVLCDRFGTAMLFWVRFNCYSSSDRRRGGIRDFFIHSTTFVESPKEFDQLEKSRTYLRQLYRKDYNIHTTLDFFMMIKNLPSDLRDKDVSMYLQEKLGEGFSLDIIYSRHDNTHGKSDGWYQNNLDINGNPFDEEMISGTSIYIDKEERIMHVPNYGNSSIYKNFAGPSYDIYLDGPIGIALFHGKIPIAIISFSLLDIDTIFIHQIQAISGQHFDRYGRLTGEYVATISKNVPWQDALSDILILIAKKHKCTKVVLQSGENNSRTRKIKNKIEYDEYVKMVLEIPSDEPHLSLAAAQKIYDVFAENKGFTKNDTSKNWDMDI